MLFKYNSNKFKPLLLSESELVASVKRSGIEKETGLNILLKFKYDLRDSAIINVVKNYFIRPGGDVGGGFFLRGGFV